MQKAFSKKETILKELFSTLKLDYPPRKIYIRVFKKEAELEVWTYNPIDQSYVLVKQYPICYVPGVPGPKRAQGDNQVPEGFYYINCFNPSSRFHLSLGIDYPNRSDRKLTDAGDPGGEIFIHGNCVSIGCIPIEDDPIEELYILAVEARSAGQDQIPVHIFPCRFDSDECRGIVGSGTDSELKDFWDNLKSGYDRFNQTLKVPVMRIDSTGKYILE